MLVILKLPLVKVLVTTGVHWINGSIRLVLLSTMNCRPAVPFVPLITRLVPDKLTLVMCGCAAGPETTPAVIVPLTASVFVHVNPVADGRVTPPLNVPE